MSILAELLAGLGLLFVGLKLMGAHLQHAMGREVRRLLRAATVSRISAFVCGAVAGAVTQSSNAVTLIAANLVRGGVFQTRQAIPVVAGASVGTSALVFIASVNFKVAVFYLVGLVGLAFHLRMDKRAGWRDWMGVMLGLALLFLGLDFIKTAPHELDLAAAAETVGSLLTPTRGFILGALLALVTQSASTPTILAVAVVQARVMGLEDGMFLVIGANLGSGLATLVSAGDMRGEGRQLCHAAIQVKALGCLIVGGAAILARLGGVHIDTLLGGDPTFALSIVFFALQLTGALVVVGLVGLSEALAVRFSPPSQEDRLSRPHFIHDQAVRDPPTALDLVAQETGRLVTQLPALLPDLDQRDADDKAQRQAAWRGAQAIAGATDHFLTELIDQRLSRTDLDLALRAQTQVELVRALQETLHELGTVVDGFRTPPPLVFNLSESLRAVLFVLADAMPGESMALDLDVLDTLTSDRSDLLERIRRDLAASCAGEDAVTGGEEVRALMRATSLFERALWLVRRLCLALRPRANEDNSPEWRSLTPTP